MVEKGEEKNEGSENVSPIAVQKYLKGADYPATKEELANIAEENGASDEVLDMINELPDEEFESSKDVMKAYGEINKKRAKKAG